jgi:hypothetical protein
LKSDPTIFNPSQRYTLQIPDQGFGIFAAVRFHYRDDDIDALLFEEVGVFEHLIGFAYTGCGADVDT